MICPRHSTLKMDEISLMGDKTMTESEKMSWDLSQLVEFDDPAYIDERLTAAVQAMEHFRDKNRGKIASFTPSQLLEMLEELDRLYLEFEGPIIYCYMIYDADMNQEVSKRLHDRYRNAYSSIQQAVAFLKIELGELLTKSPDIVNAPVLAEYKHMLEKILRAVPYMMSEKEEQIVIAKDKNGVHAWSILQGDWLASQVYDIEIDGEKKTLPYGEIISLYNHPDRDLRRRVHEIVYHNLGEDEIVWASALRAVFSDHLTMCKLREYPSPMTQSFISNDVDEETITALMNTIEKNAPVYQNYLKLKAKVMDLEKLGNWDIMAPLPSSPEKKYAWDESRKLVVDAYTQFDDESGKWIEEMFERQHIDAVVRTGKRSGAYCQPWHAGKSAYILQSFNGVTSDVFDQAHELGHALHAYLGSRAQKFSNMEVSMCVAETGSIFGELLLTDKLLSEIDSEEERRSILVTVCDEFGDTAFQVSTRTWFETMLYEAIEKGKFLDGETISDYWVKARTKMYGDAVEWLPEMKWWWTFKLHFYMADRRYYNYPYVYAQLFVYALYRLYRELGKEFVAKFKALLAAGSSKSPLELAAEMGFDITKEEFWQKGIDQFKEFIKQLEATL
jgi:oligoendopeptidase F